MLEKNKNDIYAELRKQKYVTTEKLRLLGVTNYDINKLLKEGKLYRLTRGYYSVNICGTDFNHKQSKLKLARTALNNEDYDKVLKILKDYVHLDKSKNAHYLLFQTYLYLDEYKLAKDELVKSIELSNELDTMKNNDLFMISKLIYLDEEVKTLKLKK